jgi:hypothetical protein
MQYESFTMNYILDTRESSREHVHPPNPLGEFQQALPDAKSPTQCAGLNRHEAGNASVLRERSSEPLGPEFCVVHREMHGEA